MPIEPDFKKGYKAYDKGNYATALEHFMPLAQNGCMLSQCCLGMMYSDGQGIERNLQEAFYWQKKSAEQGNMYAQSLIGTMLMIGEGVTKDEEEALYWFTESAERGNPQSQYTLGLLYMLRISRGDTELDWEEGFYWLAVSAEQGYPDAKKSIKKARKFLKRRKKKITDELECYVTEQLQGVIEDITHKARVDKKMFGGYTEEKPSLFKKLVYGLLLLLLYFIFF